MIITGDFVEDYEIMVPFQILVMTGHTVHAVCPGKKSGEKIITAVHDFETEQTYSEKRGHYFTLNCTFDDVKVEEYDALLIPGGRAPEYLRMNDKVLDMVKHFLTKDKPIASICHGIQLLTATGLVKGRMLTCYPACSFEVIHSGGIYTDTGLDKAHVDKNIVTA